MDLVDEQHLPLLQVRQEGGEVTGLLQHRSSRRTYRHTELVPDHVSQRRLAQTWRPVEQDVIQSFGTLARRRDRDLEVGADSLLANVLCQRARKEAGLVLRVLVVAGAAHDPVVGHASVWAGTRRTEQPGYINGRSGVLPREPPKGVLEQLL